MAPMKPHASAKPGGTRGQVRRTLTPPAGVVDCRHTRHGVYVYRRGGGNTGRAHRVRYKSNEILARQPHQTGRSAASTGGAMSLQPPVERQRSRGRVPPPPSPVASRGACAVMAEPRQHRLATNRRAAGRGHGLSRGDKMRKPGSCYPAVGLLGRGRLPTLPLSQYHRRGEV